MSYVQWIYLTRNEINLLRHVGFLFLLERSVEVVMSLDRQNALISVAHDGLTNSLTSKAQSAHFGRDKAS